MGVRVAINGFGRIGRNFFRAALAQGADVEVVAVNDLSDVATLAHLLRYDSVLGRFGGDVVVDRGGPVDQGGPVDGVGRSWRGGLVVDGRRIAVLNEKDPAALPWGDLGVDVVVESTGRFTDARKAAAHREAGARKVVISAPATHEDVTLVLGINEDAYDPARHHVVSNASCTTNCLAPLVKVLNDGLGVEQGTMLTIHAYTQDQNLQDGPHRDPRRARAAAVNIVPTTTGAATAIGRVLPELEGRLDGYSIRVPTPVGSLTDLTVRVGRPTTREEINDLFAKAAAGELAGILSYADEPLVSADIVTDPASCIFDSLLTKVVDERHVKVFGWYDNEWGFSNRLVETVLLVGRS